MKQLGLIIIISVLLSGCIWTTPDGKKSILPQFTANLLAEKRMGYEKILQGSANQNQMQVGIDLLALKRTAPVLGASFRTKPIQTLGAIGKDIVVTAAESFIGFKVGEAAVDWVADEFGSKSDETTVVNNSTEKSPSTNTAAVAADSSGQTSVDNPGSQVCQIDHSPEAQCIFNAPVVE